MVQTTRFVRKPFYVEAVEITETNMADVSRWCKGKLLEEEGRQFIKVKVDNVINEKQTKGFPGDWVLKSTNGFKVYTAKAFFRNFERETLKNTPKVVPSDKLVTAKSGDLVGPPAV